MIIDKVVIDGLRGLNKAVELGKRTLVTGPNGSGKSAIVAAIEFVLLGHLLGFKKKDAITNAAAGIMSAVISTNGKDIRRTIKQGKTLQDRVSVDGGPEANGSNADALIHQAVNGEAGIFNSPEFWALSSAEKRRRILAVVADEETQEDVDRGFQKAKTAQKEARSKRRAAEQTLEQLHSSLAQSSVPPGNIDRLKEERAQAEKDLEDVRQRVAEGKANDAAREKLESQSAAITELKAEIKSAKNKNAKLQRLITKCDKALAALALEDPGELPEAYTLPDHVVDKLTAATGRLEYVLQAVDGTVQAETIQAVIDMIGEVLSGPPKELVKEIKEHQAARTAAERNKERAVCDLQNGKADLMVLQSRLESAEKAQRNIEDVGPGLDENDEETLIGVTKRHQAVTEQIEALEKVQVLEAEIEKARLNVEKCQQVEAQASGELKTLQSKVAGIVLNAEREIQVRAAEILPAGLLVIKEDDTEFTLAWQKPDKTTVPRQALSGGERVLFDCAVAHALAPSAVVAIEAAEVDSGNLNETLARIPDGDFQVLALTWHEPENVPDGWSVIRCEKGEV